jgi:hypothetical protein
MNGWSALTTDEVLNQFNDSELTAYDSAKGDAHSVALPDIIIKVMDQITDAYLNAGRLLDSTTGLIPATGTIPAGEKNRAIAIARFRYLLAIPTGKALAENREDDAKKAEEYFVMISKREIKAPGGVAALRRGVYMSTHSFDRIGHT